MPNKIDTFNQLQLKQNLPNLKPGYTIRVYQKIKEDEKERTQVFEGVIIALKHGKGISGTITVRRVISGIGVERVFPLHSPNVEKIEVIKIGKMRRAKLYYLRQVKGKKARLKNVEFPETVAESAPKTETSAEQKSDVV